jgi:hypothetical protein
MSRGGRLHTLKLKPKVRKISRPGLVRKADAAFSRFVRISHADANGFVRCVTCGKAMPWQESQAGHWIKRGHAAVRFDPRNVYPQCPADNYFKDGLQDEMALHILRTHGPDTVEDLMRLKHTTRRWTVAELRELIEKYREDA